MRRLALVTALAPALFALPGGPAPAQKAMIIVSPVAAAETLQVTETFYNCGNGPLPGPLRLGGAVTFQVRRPDKFRLVSRGFGAEAPPPQTEVSDGGTLTVIDGKKKQKHPAERWEWPFPLTGLLNMPGPVRVVPAVRHGHKVLLAVRALGPAAGDHVETLYDIKSHLPREETIFITWQGKTYATLRTVYTGWALNGPLAPAVFKP